MQESSQTTLFSTTNANIINNVAKLSWKDLLADEKKEPYFLSILERINEERKKGTIVYPPNSDIFNAFCMTEFSDIKVVIIGQDPYHGPGQAHGLSFSVKQGVKPPPSLVNIYKELNQDLNFQIPTHGCLEEWAKQGVLLLNAVLSVQAGKPNSHKEIGWERFTDKVISIINEKLEHIVFILWGANAQKKCAYIDRKKHLVLECPHPSPFSAHSGFFGCRHFSKANAYLAEHNKAIINWQI